MPTTPSLRYSAIAQFWLIADDHRYPLSQVAPEFVILQRPGSPPAGPAELLIDIEGQLDSTSVHILDRTDGDIIRISRD